MTRYELISLVVDGVGIVLTCVAVAAVPLWTFRKTRQIEARRARSVAVWSLYQEVITRSACLLGWLEDLSGRADGAAIMKMACGGSGR